VGTTLWLSVTPVYWNTHMQIRELHIINRRSHSYVPLFVFYSVETGHCFKVFLFLVILLLLPRLYTIVEGANFKGKASSATLPSEQK